MATYIATLAAGLEDIGVEELLDLGVRDTATRDGAVLMAGPAFPSPEGFAFVAALNHWLLGFDRVGVLLAEAEVHDLDDCHELARGTDVSAFVTERQSLAVRGYRRGEQSFRSMQVAGEVGHGLLEALESQRGTRGRVSLSDPDVIIRCDVVGTSCRLWFDATGDEPLYQRDYRRHLHPASMRPSMAHLLLRLAGWRGGPLLDPMTGIGTIPIEAGLYARGVAPGSRRSVPMALERSFAGLVPEDFSVTSGLRAKALLDEDEHLDICGVELYEQHVHGARMNLAAAGLLTGISIEQGDACRLESAVEDGAYPTVVVNPPFGRRVGSTAAVAQLYREFVASAGRVGVDSITALVENARLMEAAFAAHGAAGYEVVRSSAVRYGDLPAHVVMARRAVGAEPSHTPDGTTR